MVGRMTPGESLEYSKVKIILIQRFRYTTEGYREKFRDDMPEEAETGDNSLLDYWDILTVGL